MKLTATDYNNILALMSRVPLQGLAEAEGAVVLSTKIRMAIAELSQVQVEPAAPKRGRPRKESVVVSETGEA